MEMRELAWCHDHTSSSYSSSTSGRNVFSLLAQREISPRTKHVSKWHWGESSKSKSGSCSHPKSEAVIDAKRGLLSWAETESLRHLSAKYSPLLPPPRSTIAAAFSPDGKVLASTHGDHTVKIIDCETGNCLKVLVGHRRTPWVVKWWKNIKELNENRRDYNLQVLEITPIIRVGRMQEVKLNQRELWTGSNGYYGHNSCNQNLRSHPGRITTCQK